MAEGGDVPFKTEYAKSNRSSCKKCKSTITKDSLRMAKMVQSAAFDGKIPHWYHFQCFFAKTKPTSVADIGGMGGLRWEDQQLIKDKIGVGGATESTDGPVAGSKRKKGQKSSDGAKKAKKDIDPVEQELQEQSTLIWKVRDDLSTHLSNGELKSMLEYNNQYLTKGGESRLLDGCSDGMVFGALPPCDTCGGQLVPRTHWYSCTGNISDWTKCTVTTTTVKRKKWTIPADLKKHYPFLKEYKYENRDRVFSEPPPTPSIDSATPSASTTDPSKPLNGFTVRIIGKLSKTQKVVSADIKEMGGEVVSRISAHTTICISTQSEVDSMGRPMKGVEKWDVPVVDEGYLEGVTKGGDPLGTIASHTISSWGAPRNKLPSKEEIVSKKSKMFESEPKTIKMKVKGGAVVDPDSGLESTHHVLDSGSGNLYTAVLGMVDVIRGTNSYYKLQVLESDTHKNFRVFRSWGRVGTTIGGSKIENYHSDELDAKEAFENLYYEKTGNNWRARKQFQKVAGKFYPLDIDYGGQEEDVDSKMDLAQAGSNSKLAPEIQNLVRMIFDIESMKKALVEFEIDTKKMPLGKLSHSQMQRAYTVLSSLLREIQGDSNPARLLDYSNQFYTLIPHDFGMQKPPLLDTEEVISTKTQMLDSLMEIELAYSILKSEDKEGESKDPLDVHFEKLHTDMEVVPRTSEEYKDLSAYVKNTHGSTHSHYNLELMDVFKITRKGESKRFKPFARFDNRMLLWHGSRLTNFVGILSQGLRIAPPEAPSTGYMFGKGVYFADMVSKSANYCWTSQHSPIGLMLLCEVALGEMYEKTSAEFVTQLPAGKHSTKGLGRTAPDPAHFKTTDSGAIIPLGEGKPTTDSRTSLLYNEYIVYDVAQINMKYLLKMNFKY